MRLTVLDPGPQTTLQDKGRTGLRHLGVPVSGPADAEHFALIAALAETETAYEFRLMGPKLRVEDGPIAFAASVGVTVIQGESRMTVPPFHLAHVQPGAILQCAPLDRACGYLALSGTPETPAILGAYATTMRAGFGRALAAGDEITLTGPLPEPRHLRAPTPPSGPLRVILGPQDDAFPETARDTFLGSDYRVTQQADRMGARLEGPEITHKTGPDIISDGIMPGAIQVPATGQPIILGVDAQTIGGYTKIATVITADLPRFGQLRPGETVRFEAVTRADAIAALKQRRKALADAIAAMKPGAADATLNMARLYDSNLISGVISE
ncbi:biotin-dependent carboxyltransferase family protein [Paracoccaceae bacterium GXU_MW_L88]